MDLISKKDLNDKKEKLGFFALIERKNENKKSFWPASIDIKPFSVDL